MLTTPITTAQADLLRTAVQAKIAYWDALSALELEMANGELSSRKESELAYAVGSLAAVVDTADTITDENAQEVFDAVRRT